MKRIAAGFVYTHLGAQRPIVIPQDRKFISIEMTESSGRYEGHIEANNLPAVFVDCAATFAPDTWTPIGEAVGPLRALRVVIDDLDRGCAKFRVVTEEVEE